MVNIIKGEGLYPNGILENELLTFIYQSDLFLNLPYTDDFDNLIRTYIVNMFTAQFGSVLQCMESILYSDKENSSYTRELSYKYGVTDFVTKNREIYTSSHVRYWNILYIIINNKTGIPENSINNILKKTIINIKDNNFNYLPEPILLDEKLLRNIWLNLKKYKSNSKEDNKIIGHKIVEECKIYFENNFRKIKIYASWWADANASSQDNELHISNIKKNSSQYIITSYIDNLNIITLNKSLIIDKLIMHELSITEIQNGGGFLNSLFTRPQKNISELAENEARTLLNTHNYNRISIKSLQDEIDNKRKQTHKEIKNKILQLLRNMLKVFNLLNSKEVVVKSGNSRSTMYSRRGGKKIYRKKSIKKKYKKKV